ncbi:MAG: Adenylyl cyclase CyaB [Candidatus Magasanikbacteria bacterium GW2011_GWC2_37_14]|uniref:Adenylyl cyclase CyaB n=1 Tax=Candidatus Magasanikbacteria bacterium GW2011_GWC2_37_14 TaxID=1619046 RepID=A0A0G0GBI4_9BACT|nr:MAG: Adenylyl cyclase CyaB [Candidatus Magasanikbacteria bacterium GW2011_GWC2_37_14]
MKEIELKVLEINEKEIIKKILALGAKRIMKKTLFDERIFDFKNRSIKKAHNLCRLRKEGNNTFLNFKFKGINYQTFFKVSEETQVEVSDFALMEKILNGLGLFCVTKRKKTRISYRLHKVRFEIDKYPEIPTYLELEGPEKDILSILKKLKIDIKNTTNLNAGQVFKHYGLRSDA